MHMRGEWISRMGFRPARLLMPVKSQGLLCGSEQADVEIWCGARRRWRNLRFVPLCGYRHFRRFGAVQRIVFDLENEQYGPCRIPIMSRNPNIRESGQTLWPLGAHPPGSLRRHVPTARGLNDRHIDQSYIVVLTPVDMESGIMNMRIRIALIALLAFIQPCSPTAGLGRHGANRNNRQPIARCRADTP